MQLIIPAFNEEGRLPDTLRALRTYVLAAADGPGPVLRFAMPTVAAGRVYIGMRGAVYVYGLLPGVNKTRRPTPPRGFPAFSGAPRHGPAPRE